MPINPDNNPTTISTPKNNDASLAMSAATIGADTAVEMRDRGTTMDLNTGLGVQQGELTAESTTSVESDHEDEAQEPTATTESDSEHEVQEVASIPGAVLTDNPKKRKAETLSGGESPASTMTIDSDTECDPGSDCDSEETTNINTSNTPFDPKRRKTLTFSDDPTATTTIIATTARTACMLSEQNRRGIIRHKAEIQAQNNEIVRLKAKIDAISAENVALKAEISTLKVSKAEEESCTDLAESLAETKGDVTKLEDELIKLREQIADLRANEKIIRAVTSQEVDVLRAESEHKFETFEDEQARDLRRLRTQIERLAGTVMGLLHERQFGLGDRTRRRD